MFTSQARSILNYMRSYGSITQREAINDLGCYRLSARIYDLKQQGVKIKTTNKQVKTRAGIKTYVAEYSLEEDK